MVRTTLTKENCNELGALVDLAKAIGAGRFCLYWLVPTGRGMDAYNRLQLGPSSHPQTAGAVPATGWQISTRRAMSIPASSPGPRNSLSGMSGKSRFQNSGLMR